MYEKSELFSSESLIIIVETRPGRRAKPLSLAKAARRRRRPSQIIVTVTFKFDRRRG